MAAQLRPRRRAEGKPEALFEGDPSFARGFGRRTALEGGFGAGPGRSPDVSREHPFFFGRCFTWNILREGPAPSDRRRGDEAASRA